MAIGNKIARMKDWVNFSVLLCVNLVKRRTKKSFIYGCRSCLLSECSHQLEQTCTGQIAHAEMFWKSASTSSQPYGSFALLGNKNRMMSLMAGSWLFAIITLVPFSRKARSRRTRAGIFPRCIQRFAIRIGGRSAWYASGRESVCSSNSCERI